MSEHPNHPAEISLLGSTNISPRTSVKRLLCAQHSRLADGRRNCEADVQATGLIDRSGGKRPFILAHHARTADDAEGEVRDIAAWLRSFFR
jgi:hypothetical protein